MALTRLLSHATLLSLLVALPARAALPDHIWSFGAGGTSSEHVHAVDVDAVGNVVIVGEFSGTIDLGGDLLTSAGSTDVYVAKYNNTGDHKFSKRFGGTSLDTGHSVAFDAFGNVIVAGSFFNVIDFGGGNLTSAGVSDIFVAKLDADGSHLWSHRFGAGFGDNALYVDADQNGDVLIAGSYAGSVDFGGGIFTAVGGSAFLARYDANGTHEWSRGFTIPGMDGWGCALDYSGNMLIAGQVHSAVDLGGGPLPFAGGADVFLAKFEADGDHVWSHCYGGPNYEFVEGLALDAMGNPAIAGTYLDHAGFGGAVLTNVGEEDIFIAKYNADGSHRWSRGIGGVYFDFGWGMTQDAQGSVFVTGSFLETITVGTSTFNAVDGYDMYAIKYDHNGDLKWWLSFGSTASEEGHAIAVGATGRIHMTGTFASALDFGGGPIPVAGLNDVYLATFGDLSTSIGPRSSAEISLNAFPNPFNPSTTIEATLPQRGRVELAIFDVTGNRVATLIDDDKPAGLLRARWDGKADAGGSQPTGVYFARVTQAGRSSSYKMLLLK